VLTLQVLRLITSAYIRSHVDIFSPFLLSPTTFLPLTTDEFCRQEVEPCGKEADHAQIMALADALNIGVRVAYLDRSEIGSGDVINWVEFGKETAEEDRPLTLLYR
jgi:ubiquitin thioesterase protein OTUB1